MNREVIFSWIESIFEALILALILYFIFWPITIDGSSMEPTFSSSDKVIVTRLPVKFIPLNYGDIVICKVMIDNEKRTVVKRVVALPDDHVKISEGSLYVNNKLVKENYINSNTKGNIDKILDEKEYYVLGDNRDNSTDSRYLGSISLKDIEAKVLFKWYPFNEMEAF